MPRLPPGAALPARRRVQSVRTRPGPRALCQAPALSLLVPPNGRLRVQGIHTRKDDPVLMLGINRINVP